MLCAAGDHIMKLRAEEPSSGFPEVKYPTLPTEDSMNEASGVSHPNGLCLCKIVI